MRRLAITWLLALPLSAAPPTLTLRQAEADALANHPRIGAARLEAAAASQQVTQARAALFPFVSGNLTGAGAPENTRIAAGALNNPSILSRFSTGITATQLIYDFGRTSNFASSVRYSAAAQQDTATATEADVLLEVDRAFHAALRAQAVLTVANETVKTRQILADQVTELAKSKLKSGLDVSFARVNLAEAKLLLANAQNDVDAAFAALSAAMGLPSAQRFELIEDPLPPAPPSDFRDILATAIQKRPELESLRARRESAVKMFDSEKNLWLPSVSAVTSIGLVPGPHTDQLPDRYAAAGLNVNIPILNGRLYSARREEANLLAQAAERRLQDRELQVARDVRLAWLNARNAWERLGLTRELLDQARQALELAQARYDIGLSSIVELSQAQLNMTSAGIEQASAKYEYQIRRDELEYQMGELR
ncbi:MAG: TolC family protein [Acidobacteriota bacterium]